VCTSSINVGVKFSREGEMLKALSWLTIGTLSVFFLASELATTVEKTPHDWVGLGLIVGWIIAHTFESILDVSEKPLERLDKRLGAWAERFKKTTLKRGEHAR
jgi:hypothetical protein